MMPKSRATYWPAGVTRMLPGCMSAWKKPSRNTWVKKISTPARDRALRSTPPARSASIWPTGVPCMRSITITCDEQPSQCTSGTASSGECRKLRRSWAQLAASRIRSSSSSRCLANSATTSRGFRRRPSGQSISIRPAPASSRATSWAMTRSMPGRRIFTATSRPSGRTAKCTCATEALASGCAAKSANTSPTGLPKACSSTASACAEGKGGTWSCSFASSSARSTGSRSRRVDSTWPNLTKIGPSASSARRSRTARGADRSRQNSRLRSARARRSVRGCSSTSWSRPKRRPTPTIFRRRKRRKMRAYSGKRRFYPHLDACRAQEKGCDGYNPPFPE